MASTMTPAPGMIHGGMITVATTAPIVARLPMCRRRRHAATRSRAATSAYQTEELARE